MTHGIPESDWKIFRGLREAALNRFCDLILSEVAEISANPSLSSHQRDLKIYRRIEELDEELALLFNDTSRSKAMRQLAGQAKRNLLSVEELARFSAETKAMIQQWIDI